MAIRAAADNGDRALLLGIPVPRLDTIVWCIAAVLSAAAVLLRVPVLGFSSFQTVSGGGDELLLFTLAAAVIGRMESLPRTAVAAVAIGIYQSLATWTFANTTFVDATLVIVIVVALLVQKDAYRRVSSSLGSTWRDIASVRPIPRTLARLPEVRWSMRAVTVALLAGAALLPVLLTTSQTYLAALILIYAIVGLSLLVLTGWAGQISLGQFALAGVGGATTAVLFQRHGWDFALALVAGVVVGALAALVIGVPALRIQGPFLAVTTLAFALSVSTYFLAPNNLPWFVTVQINRPTIFGADVLGQDWQIYYLCLVSFLLVMLAVRSLRRSRTGRALIATRDNEAATKAAALSTTRMKLTAFAVSGGIAGFAGAIFVVHQRGVNNGSFSADISIALFLMVVVGGAASLPGVVIGAVYVWGTQYYLHGGFSLVASGLGILVLLIVLPEGLGGLLYRLRDGLLRDVARHKGIPLTGPFVADAEPSGPDRGATAILEEVGEPNGDWGADRHASSGATPIGPAAGGRRDLFRLLPLIVVAGLGAMAQLNALALLLVLPDLRGTFHSGLFFVSTIAVAGAQVGLLLDVGVGALANRVRRLRLLCAGMGLAAVGAALVAVAGHASSVVLLDVASAIVAVAAWAFTSTQNGLLADYYAPDDRPRVYVVQRTVIAGTLALGPAVVGTLELFYDWRVPFVVLAVPTAGFVVLGLVLRPANAAARADGGRLDGPGADASEPATFAEAIRVLFTTSSIRYLYYALPFLVTLVVGVRHFADLLERNVFHVDAASRALSFALVAPGAFVGLLVGLVVFPRLMATDPGRALRLVAFTAVGASACLAAVTLAPSDPWAVGAQFAYGLLSSWLLVAIYVTISLAAPPRILVLAFALTSCGSASGSGWSPRRACRSSRPSTGCSATGPGSSSSLPCCSSGRASSPCPPGTSTLTSRSSRHRPGRHRDPPGSPRRSGAAADGPIGRRRLRRSPGALRRRPRRQRRRAGRDPRHERFRQVDAPADHLGAAHRHGRRGDLRRPRHHHRRSDPHRREGDRAGPGRSEHLRRALGRREPPRRRLAALGKRRRASAAIEAALQHFPVLHDRWDIAAGSLSGGEQQMLGLAQAFITRPRLLMIDELSLGLTPVVIDRLVDIVRAIHQQGTTVILVEQSVTIALRLADRAIFMERGEVLFSGPASQLVGRDDLVRAVFLDGTRAGAVPPSVPGPLPLRRGVERSAGRRGWSWPGRGRARRPWAAAHLRWCDRR